LVIKFLLPEFTEVNRSSANFVQMDEAFD